MTNIKEKTTELFRGAPELRIVRLVRRAHLTSECRHEGNCLNDKDMIAALHNTLAYFARDVIKKITPDTYENEAWLGWNACRGEIQKRADELLGN